ncbi:MAG TPA: ATP-binding cassette domain-containing protein, partial [Ilumatobacteraceae bacterium]|nr:ATP-binding cassette domain-containing protein [Ilumatobacteraceae bacterium]
MERLDLFPDPRPAAELSGVVRRFPGINEVVTALDGIDAVIQRGQMTVVAGPSGSGKSTLLALLACAQRPDEGSVRIGDTDVAVIG